MADATLKAALDSLDNLTCEITTLKKAASKSGWSPDKIFAEPKNRELDRRHGFKNSREFILKVMEFGQHARMDDRLKGLHTKTVGSDEARGISDPAGGFLIPYDFHPDVLKIDPEKDPMGALTTKIPMASPEVRIPARADKNHTSSVSGGLTVGRKAETVAAAASQMTLEQVVLNAHSLFGLSYATEELLTDSPISFAALLSAGFQDQFTYHLIKERMSGTGVGEFLGVLNSAALVSVAKETGQPGATIITENVYKMRSRCWGYSKAIWIANHDCGPMLASLNQVGGTGTVWPLLQQSAKDDFSDVLLGRPLIYSEYCKTLGTVGDIVLVNWSEYLEGNYQPLQNEESVHVRFVNHERTFKFWLRNAGQPWWRAALTPAYSTQTLSPYVALATRA